MAPVNDHIGPEFRAAFPTWDAFTAYVASRATTPEYDPARALHQIVAADFGQRLEAAGDHEWVLMGSLTLPGRASTEHPPRGFGQWTPGAGVDPVYRAARRANDLDMSALDLARPDAAEEERIYGPTIAGEIEQITSATDERGIGLGGLVRYSVEGSLTTSPNVKGVVKAQPVDPRYGPNSTVPVGDPILLTIDIKPPRKVAPTTAPLRSSRPVVAVDIPGMRPYLPLLHPTINQLADKVTALVGPAVSLRHLPGGPHHRYKDLFDITYMLNTAAIQAGPMRHAVLNNWGMSARLGITDLPEPYQIYGTAPGQPAIPWEEMTEQMRQKQPELRMYPSFSEMSRQLSEFADGLKHARPEDVWRPGQGWTRGPVATRDSTVNLRKAVRRGTARGTGRRPSGPDAPRNRRNPGEGGPPRSTL
ncbi:hypothetical protein LG943_22100 [Streptomonospora sp. S1-112]|uniref:Uncharacterized protein n=1 Tax=Streptomonospora mangrovi TaxID=2883123 RepID=A0A9X3NP82_9ACTN|nr:hypothetical protein [Streptomonospora mangrovi]MDA0566987.1 hypothetical protein [Streptomonospora mangrovi]